ncbi:MAG: hypothetical protein ACOYL6_11535 [Bacteriovoracaceae bacterium]
MKFNFFLLIIYSLCISCSNGKPLKEKAPPTLGDPEESESKIVKDYSAEQMGEALNVMRVVLDHASKKPNADFCHLTAQEASLMSQQLRFLIEEKISTLGKPKNPPMLWRECKQTCSCYVYSRVYGGENQFFENAAKSINSADALDCAKRSQWFCGSSLHQYLESLSTIGEANY